MKKVLLLNKEAGRVSQLSYALFSKATEEFVKELVLLTAETLEGKQVMRPENVLSVTQSHERFEFIRDLVEEFIKERQNESGAV